MVDDIICSKCNARNPSDTVFCGKCGTKIAQADTVGVTEDPLIGSFVGDRFLVREKLGEGGMGVVYLAEQTAINRVVALKVLHANLTQDKSLHARFQNEAAASSRLNHPNTITVYDFGQTESQSLYIAMEYVEGTSLDDEIRNFGAMDWRQAMRLAVQMCGSLADAHQNSIVHRDLKPENVMLCKRGEEEAFIKVLDFGIAKIVEDDGTDQVKALTKTGMVFGTPQYMSPEQIRGEKVDPRTDIYSMGVIIYQMLTGLLPFVAEQPMGVLSKHLIDRPPSFKKANANVVVPREVEAVVMAALEKEADKRPQSMRELSDRLSVAAGFNGGSSPVAAFGGAGSGNDIPETVEFPSSADTQHSAAIPSGRKRQGIIIAAVVGLLLLIGGGGAWYLLGSEKNNRGVERSGRKAAVTASDVTKEGTLEPPTGDLPQAPPPVPPTVSDVIQTEGEHPPSGDSHDKTATTEIPVDKKVPSTATKKNSGKSPKTKTGTKTDTKTGTDTGTDTGTKTDTKTGTDTGTNTEEKSPSEVACVFSSSQDPVAQAIRRMLSQHERQIKKCARGGASGVTAFRLRVPGNASRAENIKTATSSDMDSCLRTVLGGDFGAREEERRQGTVRFALTSKNGVIESCHIRVTLRSKVKRGQRNPKTDKKRQ